MIRLFVVFLPFLLYFSFLLIMKRDVKERANWPYKRVILLTIAGVLLTFSTFALFNNGASFDEYRPATFENGVFKPAERIKKP